MEVQSTYRDETVTAVSRRRISLPSVFAGALVALGVQLLLALLGMGIGMGTVDPQQEQNPMAGLGTGALIWWIVSFLISLFSGGWVAGRLSATANRFDNSLHGVLTWIVFVILNLYLLGTAAGGILRGASGVLGNTMQIVGQGAAMNAPQIQNRVQQELNQRGIDQSDVQGKLNELEARKPELEAKARAVGDDVASALSKAGIFGFIGLLIGAIVAAIAARFGAGTRERTAHASQGMPALG